MKQANEKSIGEQSDVPEPKADSKIQLFESANCLRINIYKP
jgi:hypothetical protein